MNSTEQYQNKFPRSYELWKRALGTSRGIHHDARHALPFPIFSVSSSGTRVIDVDGHEHIDYSMGHGALLLGHAHPTLVDAVNRQVLKGTHYGSEHESCVEWAELICDHIPSAQKVEFVMSGTEANMLIAQLVRGYTGRQKIVKFTRHFMGWGDHFHVGIRTPYDQPFAGRLKASVQGAVSDATVVAPINDIDAVETLIARGDVAALFLEGAGNGGGATKLPSEVLKRAREVTRKYGTLLVLDEVITGFRWSPGGYQATEGVVPDLTTLGKLISGGLPGGAVCGSAEVMDLLAFKPGDADWNRHKRIFHPGTWNGNPLSAAAGLAMLKEISSGEPQKQAERQTAKLAEGMRRELGKRGMTGCVYNSKSVLHIHLGKCQGCSHLQCLDHEKSMSTALTNAMVRHMRLNGLNFQKGIKGFVSAVHTDDDVALTIEKFGAMVEGLMEEGFSQ